MQKLKGVMIGLLLTLLASGLHAQVLEGFDAPQQEVTASGKKIIRSKLLSPSEAKTQEPKSTPRILMYFRNFKINTTPSGRIMCDFDLTMRNATSNKINTLSAQFIWPNIQTSASFYEVPARHERYVSLTLMGKGCYSMDKAPNIVMNHCRIKGMSSEECSNAIRWVKIK